MKATRALVLFLLTVLLCPIPASAGTLGPALNYEELLDMVRRAKDGDILLVSGEMTATEEAISSPALLQISGNGKAVLHRLHISDSSVILSDVELRDSLTISGISNVELRAVRVQGAPGQSGLSLVGGGTLLIDRGLRNHPAARARRAFPSASAAAICMSASRAVFAAAKAAAAAWRFPR